MEKQNDSNHPQIDSIQNQNDLIHSQINTIHESVYKLNFAFVCRNGLNSNG